ncbi:SPASM domain-containing protein [Chryseobacterium sp. IHB B 17019]|uniref:SPASM domain-containing protein n=1 Tax=Chryseobacterium sp. IHB B 17019 TaxID=1721091 RepID=UPI001237094F|nr:SPASM domain-containing protein [Chryseobacterium sp. IHB B 17019]
MKKYLLLLASSRTAMTVGGFGTVGTVWMGRNYYQQLMALAYPETIDPNGRRGAILATRYFKRDQVGFGVYPSIRLIHLIFGNIGEQEIGKLFNSPAAQAIMRKPRTHKNHKKLGAQEVKYWISQRGLGKTIPDNMMIWFFGAVMQASARAYIQESNARIRSFITKNE